MPAKAPLADLAFGRAVERQAHVFQFDHRVNGVFRQHVGGVLISQIIAALDGIVGVPERFVFVEIAERRADPALRRSGVAARRVELADDRDLRAAFAGIKGCHQSRATCADDDRLILMCFHGYSSNPKPISNVVRQVCFLTSPRCAANLRFASLSSPLHKWEGLGVRFRQVDVIYSPCRVAAAFLASSMAELSIVLSTASPPTTSKITAAITHR